MVVQTRPNQTRRRTAPRPEFGPVEAKRREKLHLLTFVIGNALCWILWGAISISAEQWYWWPAVPLAGWTLVLALHLRHISRD